WPEIAPNTPFLPDVPVRKSLKTNDRPPREQHGMEEVVGSIPTRSTNFFLMPRVYILQSDRTKKFYIGCATEVLVRLTQHQRGQTISTHGRGPWDLVYQELFETLAEAQQLKSWKSHRSILELIEDRNTKK